MVSAAIGGGNNINKQNVAHDQGPFQSYAWLEDDMSGDTKDFIAQVEECMEQHVFQLSGNDKLVKEDACDAD